MLIIAVLGVIFNGATIFQLKKGSSLNEKVVTLHLLEDVLGWVAVLVGSIIMMLYDLPIIDPLCSILITGFILFNAAKGMWRIAKIILQAVPDAINTEKIIENVKRVEKVNNVHDVHNWTLDSELHIMTAASLNVASTTTTMAEGEEIKKIAA